ncbi:BQ2448_3787 [Microbotryum intermedium]|uniref:BQ2448_3787 protein n=1 Tax=Microbotryum intermedium TaxID=269621 RepID=A0A238FCV8_9BASI|nr:BQ2448_3787 [Microbotryum intermedium]
MGESSGAAHDPGSISAHLPDQPPPPSYASLVAPVPGSPSTATASGKTNAQGSTLSHSMFRNHAAFDHSQAALGFPSGYFILRNRGAGGRVLDLLGHKANEGAPIGLHPLKQPQVDGDQLQYRVNNQLWFMGWDGLLYSAAVSRPVECLTPYSSHGSLALAFPHPVMSIPSHRSHPCPKFVFDHVTSTLRVQFATDPTFPGPLPEDKSDWNEYDYLVEAVPQRRKRSNEQGLWDVVASGPGNLFEGLSEKIFGSKSPSLEASDPLAEPSNMTRSTSTSQGLARSAYEPYRRRSSSNTMIAPPLPARPRSRSTAPAVEDDSDSDTEPSAMRSVRVVAVPRSSRYDGISQPEPSSEPRYGTSYQGGYDLSHDTGCANQPSGQPLEASRREQARESRQSKRRQWELVSVVVRPVPTDSYPGGASYSDTERATPGSPSSSNVMRRASSAVGLSSSPRFLHLPTAPNLDRTELVRTRRSPAAPQQQQQKASNSSFSSSTSIASQGFSLPRLLKANIYGKVPDAAEATPSSREEVDATNTTDGSDLFDDEPEDARVLHLDEIGQEMARSTSSLSLSERIGLERLRAGRAVEGLQIEQYDEIPSPSLRQPSELDRPLPKSPSMEEAPVLSRTIDDPSHPRIVNVKATEEDKKPIAE